MFIWAYKYNILPCFIPFQMRNLLAFRDENDDGFPNCPCRETIRDILWQFHKNLLNHCAMPTAIGEESETVEPEEKELPSPTVRFPFLHLSRVM